MSVKQSWNKVFEFVFVLNRAQACYSATVRMTQQGLVAHVAGFQLSNRLCKVWSLWWQTGRMQRYSLGHTRGWESILRDDCCVWSVYTPFCKRPPLLQTRCGTGGLDLTWCEFLLCIYYGEWKLSVICPHQANVVPDCFKYGLKCLQFL